MPHPWTDAPLGTADRLPSEAELLARASRKVMGTLRAHGYRAAQVPMYEDFGLYERLYGQDIRQHLITFDTDRTYALRPDLTAGLCRAAAHALDGATPASPLRLASSGAAFRHERPRPLRLREFVQVGVERLGDHPDDRDGADLEILSLARLALAELGVQGGLVRVGHAQARAKLLDAIPLPHRARVSGLLDALARLRERLEPPRTGADQALDLEREARARPTPRDHADLPTLLDELGRRLRPFAPDLQPDPAPDASPAQRAELFLQRLEDALTRSAREAGLSHAQAEALLDLCTLSASLDELADRAAPLCPDLRPLLKTALKHIEGCAQDLEPCVLRFGLGPARWGDFYTGFVFELDAPVLGPDVSQLVGGGRYDRAMERLGAAPMPACGFALGLERLLAAARLLHGEEVTRKRLIPPEPLLICFTDRPGSLDKAAWLGEELGRRACPIAYHPRPIPDPDPRGGLSDSFVQALSALPGTPYRHAVLADGDELFVAHVENGSCFEADLQTLLLMFSR